MYNFIYCYQQLCFNLLDYTMYASDKESKEL